MPTVPPTDWKARLSPLDALNPQTNRPFELIFGGDDEFAINVSALLDTGETLNPAEVSRTFWRLKAQGETDDVDTSSACLPTAASVSTPIIAQRIKSLERGRYYRLEVVFGPLGNRRGAGLMIHCPE